MNTDKSDTYFVGDQLFTDVWGANRAGIKSVLVKPIDKHEEIQIILKRRLEWIVLHFIRSILKKKVEKQVSNTYRFNIISRYIFIVIS